MGHLQACFDISVVEAMIVHIWGKLEAEVWLVRLLERLMV